MSDRLPDLLDALLDRQSRAWLADRRPTVEELLDGSALRDDREAQLDLIYNEIVLREDRGESPSIEEYARRYPHLRDDLELHFEVHRAVGDNILSETPRLMGECTLREVPPVALAGAEANDYDLLHPLGRGGMGVVYKARHRRLRRTVALKMFEPGRVPSAREVVRFRTEAEAVARLQHPNVVQIFEVGERNGLPFLAFELADHGTLAQRLQRFPFAPRTAAGLIATLAGAVHHAHKQGIVHRDLKPTNILFAADDTPKLTDFGLAKILQGDDDAARDATRTGEAVGTPRYMAPEQAAGRNEAVGPATDVYALGTLLYECLTGRVPFLATSVVETLDQIRSADPPPPRRLQPSVPRDLETICLHCLHKDPARRYASAADLTDDLRRFLNGKPIMARPTPTWDRAWKWCRRRPTHAALIAVAAVLVFGVAVAGGIRNRLEQERITDARNEVEALVKEGQQALLRNEDDAAEERFRQAWVRVQGEPALRDYETGVAGWLDHARRAATSHRWTQRVPPREYDERRDEALLLSLLLDPGPDAVKAAREAVSAALELTLPDDPAWRAEREQLVLLDADLVRSEGGAEAALIRLVGAKEFSSHLFYTRRAAYLDELGRADEAEVARARAARFPPNEPAARFLAGVDQLRRRDFTQAARAFEAVLDAEPGHFTARLFLALAALHQGRPAEAKVGLTACIAQRPRFAWSYLYRGQCCEKMGDPAAAKRDFARATELTPRPR
jgi:tetratricopeptide (TPR) repeat protein/tRNA A-37 threonylcarbamoyl transferase component Bud32